MTINYFVKTVFITLALLLTRCRDDHVTIEKLQQFSKIDTVQKEPELILFKTDRYVVDNFKDIDRINKALDDFVKKHKPADVSKYANYDIVLYKSSDITNLKNLANDPGDFDGYTFRHDMIYIYSWNTGAFCLKMKFDGRDIEKTERLQF